MKWTPEEEAKLIKLYEQDVERSDIAYRLGRTVGAINHKLTDLRKNNKSAWTSEEDDKLMGMIGQKFSKRTIAAKLGRTVNSVAHRSRKLIKEKRLANKHDETQIDEAAKYLLSRGYYVLEAKNGYIIDGNFHSTSWLVDKARRVRENTDILYGRTG